MAREDSTALFVGRFQPFHVGHLHLVKGILEDVDRVLIAVGSAQFSFTRRNPFSASERHEMIRRTLDGEGLRGWEVLPVPDVGVHALWVAHLQSLVPPFDVVFSHEPLTRRLFQEAGIEVREKPLLDRDRYSGREIRRRILAGEDWRELVPPPVAAYLKEIGGGERIRTIAQSAQDDQEHEPRQG